MSTSEERVEQTVEKLTRQEELRNKVRFFAENGWSNQRISKQLGIPEGMVRAINRD